MVILQIVMSWMLRKGKGRKNVVLKKGVEEEIEDEIMLLGSLNEVSSEGGCWGAPLYF